MKTDIFKKHHIARFKSGGLCFSVRPTTSAAMITGLPRYSDVFAARGQEKTFDVALAFSMAAAVAASRSASEELDFS